MVVRFLALLLLSALFCGLSQDAAADTTRCPIDFRDPLLSGMLSMAVPGLGQVYSQQAAAGAGWFLASLTTFWAGWFIVAEPRLSFVPDLGFSASLRFYNDALPLRWILASTLWAGWIALRIGAVLHAQATARAHNEPIYRCLINREEPSVTWEPLISPFQVGIRMRFS